jgi:hypothetical protein
LKWERLVVQQFILKIKFLIKDVAIGLISKLVSISEMRR